MPPCFAKEVSTYRAARAGRNAVDGVSDNLNRAMQKPREVMIHDMQMQALQVRDIARDMDGKNLPLAGVGRFAAAGKALDDQCTLRRPVSLDHDGRLAWKGLDVNRELFDRLSILSIQLSCKAKPPDQCFERLHDAFPLL